LSDWKKEISTSVHNDHTHTHIYIYIYKPGERERDVCLFVLSISFLSPGLLFRLLLTISIGASLAAIIVCKLLSKLLLLAVITVKVTNKMTVKRSYYSQILSYPQVGGISGICWYYQHQILTITYSFVLFNYYIFIGHL